MFVFCALNRLGNLAFSLACLIALFAHSHSHSHAHSLSLFLSVQHRISCSRILFTKLYLFLSFSHPDVTARVFRHVSTMFVCVLARLCAPIAFRERRPRESEEKKEECKQAKSARSPMRERVNIKAMQTQTHKRPCFTILGGAVPCCCYSWSSLAQGPFHDRVICIMVTWATHTQISVRLALVCIQFLFSFFKKENFIHLARFSTTTTTTTTTITHLSFLSHRTHRVVLFFPRLYLTMFLFHFIILLLLLLLQAHPNTFWWKFTFLV